MGMKVSEMDDCRSLVCFDARVGGEVQFSLQFLDVHQNLFSRNDHNRKVLRCIKRREKRQKDLFLSWIYQSLVASEKKHNKEASSSSCFFVFATGEQTELENVVVPLRDFHMTFEQSKSWTINMSSTCIFSVKIFTLSVLQLLLKSLTTKRYQNCVSLHLVWILWWIFTSDFVFLYFFMLSY
jgi:hypothetical protein